METETETETVMRLDEKVCIVNGGASGIGDKIAKRDVGTAETVVIADEEEIVNDVMLADTVDQELTTVKDVAKVALFFAAFQSNARTDQSLVVSQGGS